VIGDAEALVVKDDITSFDDLKGKTIATPIASTSHYSLLAALEEHNLSETDVKIIDAEPDAIYAAWSQGDIDGAYVWNPNLAKIVDDGGKILVTSAELAKKGKTTYDLGVAASSFASQYPAAVQTWVEQQNRAVELIKSDPDKAATDIAAELNITPEEAKAQLEGLIFVDASQQVGKEYLGGGLADNLFAAAEFNKKLGQIPSTEPKSTYVDAVVAKYAQAVADGS
jgi:taurine transport system substrate-binding protein